jgi:excisionase family DNA binding protein
MSYTKSRLEVEMDFSKKLTTEQAADYIGVSADWLLENLESRRIPYYKPARRYYFIKEQLDEWMEREAKGCQTAQTYGSNALKVQLI